MSLNVTLSEPWSVYLGHVQEQFQQTPLSRLLLLGLVNIPIIAIVLNVLRQLVCTSNFSLLMNNLSNAVHVAPTRQDTTPNDLPLDPSFWFSCGLWSGPYQVLP